MSDPRGTRVRRQRTATESLLSIALTLEAVLVFFIVLVLFGLKVLTPALSFGGGAALLVLLLIDSRLVRWPAGVWLGWVLQAVLVATGILLPLMYFVGAVFLGIWIYCFVIGRRLDRRNATPAAESPTAPTKEPA